MTREEYLFALDVVEELRSFKAMFYENYFEISVLDRAIETITKLYTEIIWMQGVSILKPDLDSLSGL